MTDRYDYLIAGAGAAGLGLAWQLLQSDLSHARILLLDPEPKRSNDRTWCFWAKDLPPLPCEPVAVWDNFRVAAPQREVVKGMGPFRYYCFRAIDYYDAIRAELAASPRVTWLQERVLGFESSEDEVLVRTDQGQYRAAWAFSSLPETQPRRNPREHKWQHFYGEFLRSDKPIFDSGTATLMDFRTEQAGEVRFYYLLPFSPTEALAEFTVFSDERWQKSRYQAHLAGYRERLSQSTGARLEVVEEEIGAIPMGTAQPEAWVQPRVLRIGLAGGAARAGTGYAFLSIQRRNREIVQSLQELGRPVVSRPHPLRHLFYDALLLRIMDKGQGQLPDIFTQLFHKHSPDRVFRFLSEETRFDEELRIMASLPWAPFLTALGEKVLDFCRGLLFRRPSGATPDRISLPQSQQDQPVVSHSVPTQPLPDHAHRSSTPV